MTCRICTELESSLQSARDPALPNLLQGLTEAGERNRVQQKLEKVQKIELLLGKHKAICRQGEEQR